MSNKIEFALERIKEDVASGNLEKLAEMLLYVCPQELHDYEERGEITHDFFIGYSEIARQIKKAPMTYLPALLGEMIEACLAHNPFRIPLPDVVAGMVRKITEKKGVTNGL